MHESSRVSVVPKQQATAANLKCPSFPTWSIIFIRSVRSPLINLLNMYNPMMKALPTIGPRIGTYLMIMTCAHNKNTSHHHQIQAFETHELSQFTGFSVVYVKSLCQVLQGKKTQTHVKTYMQSYIQDEAICINKDAVVRYIRKGSFVTLLQQHAQTEIM